MNSYLKELSSKIPAFCFDSFGDNHSGCSGYSQDGKITIENVFDERNSLGILYTAATAHLGFGGFGSEGKMQGLAPYGQYRKELSIQEFLTIKDGSPYVDPEIKGSSGWQHQEQYASIASERNEFFCELTDPRFSDEEIEQVHCDFARTIQDDIFNVIKNIISASDFSNGVILSGGIAQNSTLINYISEELSVEVFTSTSCSDRGNSLGALEYCSEIPKLHTSPFLGFDVDTEHPPKELKNAELEGKSFINKTAELLNSGEVIATLISKSELGARALGNRLILSYASDPERKDYLNRSVKHRECFVLCSICLSNVPHILENPKTSSYMTQCFKVKESFKEIIPQQFTLTTLREHKFV